ncbi:MAG: nitroreductase family protein [Desulfuromonadales bacterium]|nr:nitroreductase family protein [Desulfuromonadales bacterium]
MIDRSNPRIPAVDVDSQFTDRWSPRAFAETPLTDAQLATLFEAVRWAPSCYNEQPWLFLYAVTAEDRVRFAEALVPANRVWAPRAPLLLFVLCRRRFRHNDQENRHAPFDAGAAWLALALQARKLGLHAHAMAGFSRQKAFEILGVPEEDYDIMAAVAVGYRGDKEILPEDVAAREQPNDRKPPREVAREGRF